MAAPTPKPPDDPVPLVVLPPLVPVALPSLDATESLLALEPKVAAPVVDTVRFAASVTVAELIAMLTDTAAATSTPPLEVLAEGVVVEPVPPPPLVIEVVPARLRVSPSC